MNQITQMFRELRSRQRKALIAFLTVGFPSLPMTARCLEAAIRAGADLIELGVPFSDPIADGPTIQYASERALQQGISLSRILQFVRRLSPRPPVPLVLLTYFNPVLRFGLSRFVQAAARAGVAGVIVPDLIPEESGALAQLMRRQRLSLIFLVAPTTPLSRQRLIAKTTDGFLYVVSVTGVTGSRQTLSPDILPFLGQLRRATTKPLALGFGVSRPEHVHMVKPTVDGVIVGSALLEVLRHSGSPERMARLLRSLRHALDQAPARRRHG